MASCLSCAARFGIVYIVILNILTLLLGVGLIVLSIFLRKEINKNTEITDFLDQVNLGSFSLYDLIMIIFIALIAIGCFAIVTSLIGGCGALCRVRCLLITYIVIIIFCILVELAILGFWVYLLNTVNEFLIDKFNKLMEEYNGPTGKDLISVGWNFIFLFFDCCGVKPVTSSYNDFQSLPTKWWTSDMRNQSNDVIPSSCCTDASVETFIKTNSTDCTQLMVDYNTSGCYDVFDDIFTKLATAAITVSAILVVVEAVAIIFSCIVTCFVTEEKNKIV